MTVRTMSEVVRTPPTIIFHPIPLVSPLPLLPRVLSPPPSSRFLSFPPFSRVFTPLFAFPPFYSPICVSPHLLLAFPPHLCFPSLLLAFPLPPIRVSPPFTRVFPALLVFISPGVRGGFSSIAPTMERRDSHMPLHFKCLRRRR